MKLITFVEGGAERIGALDGETVRDLSAAAPTMLDLVRAGEAGLARARDMLATARSLPLSSVTLAPPIRPGKVLCSGINYKAHADENPNAKMP